METKRRGFLGMLAALPAALWLTGRGGASASAKAAREIYYPPLRSLNGRVVAVLDAPGSWRFLLKDVAASIPPGSAVSIGPDGLARVADGRVPIVGIACAEPSLVDLQRRERR